MRIDAHQHFWTIARGDYHWLTPELGKIYRDFTPNDLRPLLQENAIDGSILVQAAATLDETKFMLELAAATPFIKGVVGWVDFESAKAPEDIADLARHPSLVGLRPMIQDIDDPDWMLRPDLSAAFDALISQGLTFDALTLPRHLPNLLQLLQRYPDMTVVIDHASKPLIRDGAIRDWAKDITDLAQSTNAYCKLSGIVTEAAPDWTIADLKPYVSHLLETFGPTRLIWGSDWPVCTLAADYTQWVDVTEKLLSGLSTQERSAILGDNSARAYSLGS